MHAIERQQIAAKAFLQNICMLWTGDPRLAIYLWDWIKATWSFSGRAGRDQLMVGETLNFISSVAGDPNAEAFRIEVYRSTDACDAGGPVRRQDNNQSRKTIMRKSILGVAFAIACASGANAANIVETAKSAGSFDTLLAAATAAGLADALATGENLTVFAPTDEAFAALPEGTVETLLKPENKDQLVAILSYHVLPRELASNQLPGRTIHVKTIKGEGDKLLSVTKDTSGVTVNDSNVVTADIMTDNGIIHVIDKVLLPSD